jgi:ABC-type dipeptide/oligopeptide/nickel transport system permease component
MAATVVSAVLVVLGNLAADVLVTWLDPRLRPGHVAGGGSE